jgi:hypothetical protein
MYCSTADVHYVQLCPANILHHVQEYTMQKCMNNISANSICDPPPPPNFIRQLLKKGAFISFKTRHGCYCAVSQNATLFEKCDIPRKGYLLK